MEENKIYSYMAFISYKTSDWLKAQELHKKLESYKFPTYMSERHPEISINLNPIFLDKYDAKLGDLNKNIIEALGKSKFLIVVCSPDTPESNWVKKEITKFIETHSIENVIPFIIRGSYEESVPEVFKINSEGKELLAANALEISEDHALIKLIAKMLDLEVREVSDIHMTAAIAEKNRLAAEQRRLQRQESRFLSGKANQLAEEGYLHLARKVALYSLPEKLDDPQCRPWVLDAEKTLRSLVTYGKARFNRYENYLANEVAVSPDGRYFAIAGNDKACHMWRFDNGKKVHNIELNSGVYSVAFSADSRMLAVGDAEGYIRIYEVETGEELIKPFKAHSNYVGTLTFSNDGKILVSSSYEDTLSIWNADSFEFIKPLTLPGYSKGSHGISSDSRYIFTYVSEELCQVFDWTSGQNVFEFPCKSYRKGVFACGSDCIVLGRSSDSDGEVLEVWKLGQDMAAGPLKRIRLSTYLSDIDVTPDGKYLMTLTAKDIEIWDLANWRCIRKIDQDDIYHYSYAKFVTDNNHLLLVSLYGIDYVDLSYNNHGVLLGHYNSAIGSIAANKDDSRIAVSSCRDIVIWDTSSKSIVGSYKIDRTTVNVAYFQDGINLLVSTDTNTLTKINTEVGTIESVYEHGASVSMFIINHAGDKVYTQCSDRTITVWDVSTGQSLGVLDKFPSVPGHMAISSDDSYLIVGCDHDLYLYDLAENTFIKQVGGSFDDYIGSIAFAENGIYVAAAEFGGSKIKVWDIVSDKLVSELELREFPFGSNPKIAFSLDSRNLIVAFEMGKLATFDVATSRVLSFFDAHDGDESVEAFALTSEGRHYITGTDMGTLKLWSFPPFQEILDEMNELYASNPLTPEEKEEFYIE